MAKKGRGGLMLAGGARPQMKPERKGGWSKAKQSHFLTVLAETCNASQAAREAGISIAHAYRKRAADAKFRAAWFEAVAVAYQRLELVLLDRAFNGTEKVVTRQDGSEDRMREYSNQMGLSLLKMHRDNATVADDDPAPVNMDEVRERLVRKLQRMKARDDAPATPDE